MIDKVLRLVWSDTRVARRLRHRRRYPGLRIDDSATVVGEGVLIYGEGASVGRSAILVMPEGAQLSLAEYSYVGRYVEIGAGGRVVLGRAASVQDRCVILGDVVIGAYCTLAYNIYISSGDHVYAWRPALPIKVQDRIAPAQSRPVIVEEDCWLGQNVVLRAGVRIGRGAVVGANSVVTEDVPRYAVVAGAPARILRRRLDYAPPREIRFDREESLPYFHEGFHILESELAQARQAGGMLADGAFAIALGAAGSSKLIVEIRAESRGVELEYGGKRQPLAAEYRSYEFDLSGAADVHEFRLPGVASRVRVAGARVS